MDKKQLLLGGGMEAPEAPQKPFVKLQTSSELPQYYRDDKDHRVKLEIFRDTPFFRLLRAERRTKCMPVCRFLLNSYDSKKAAFCVRGKYLKLCVEEAGFVVGLRNEGEVFSGLTSNLDQVPAYYSTYAEEIVDESGLLCKSPLLGRKTLLHVLKYMMINGEIQVNFKKIIYVFLYSFVFHNFTTDKTTSQIFGFADDLERFEGINWLRHMVTRLQSDIEKVSKNLISGRAGPTLYLTSFTPLLEAWFYYRTNVDVDEKLRTRPAEAPLEYYFSEPRLEMEKSLDVNHIKHRCTSCAEVEQGAESNVEATVEATEKFPDPTRMSL